MKYSVVIKGQEKFFATLSQAKPVADANHTVVWKDIGGTVELVYRAKTAPQW